MSTLPKKVDAVVIGAGTAGAAAAMALAERGMKTLCVDRRPLDEAGARWVNGVTLSSFDDAGIARPEGDELVSPGGAFHLIAGWGPRRVTIGHHGVPDVDMRHLVARLQGLARDAGATLVGGVRVDGVDRDVHTGAGAVRADWIIDASGLSGLRLLDPPDVSTRHICAASQSVRRLEDEGAARRFWAKHDATFGENLCFTGVAGGYSILNVSIHNGEVGILTGTIPGEGHPSGVALLRDFVEEHDWIGEEIFGGSRAIPVRRPFDRLTDGRVVAIGDASSQVFPAHGSGIGAGMVAARTLADALAEGRGPHRWAAEWMRGEGGLFASYDVFRRFSQTMSARDLERLMETGLMDEATALAGKEQVPPKFPLPVIPEKIRGLVQMGALGARMAAVIGKMQVVRALYRTYPEDPRRLPAWSRMAGRVFGEAPDVQGPVRRPKVIRRRAVAGEPRAARGKAL